MKKMFVYLMSICFSINSSSTLSAEIVGNVSEAKDFIAPYFSDSVAEIELRKSKSNEIKQKLNDLYIPRRSSAYVSNSATSLSVKGGNLGSMKLELFDKSPNESVKDFILNMGRALNSSSHSVLGPNTLGFDVVQVLSDQDSKLIRFVQLIDGVPTNITSKIEVDLDGKVNNLLINLVDSSKLPVNRLKLSKARNMAKKFLVESKGLHPSEVEYFHSPKSKDIGKEKSYYDILSLNSVTLYHEFVFYIGRPEHAAGSYTILVNAFSGEVSLKPLTN